MYKNKLSKLIIFLALLGCNYYTTSVWAFKVPRVVKAVVSGGASEVYKAVDDHYRKKREDAEKAARAQEAAAAAERAAAVARQAIHDQLLKEREGKLSTKQAHIAMVGHIEQGQNFLKSIRGQANNIVLLINKIATSHTKGLAELDATYRFLSVNKFSTTNLYEWGMGVRLWLYSSNQNIEDQKELGQRMRYIANILCVTLDTKDQSVIHLKSALKHLKSEKYKDLIGELANVIVSLHSQEEYLNQSLVATHAKINELDNEIKLIDEALIKLN